MEWIVEAETLSDFIDHGRYTIASKPLIRCKDCVHVKYNSFSTCYCKHMISFNTPNGFCSHAERRTDEQRRVEKNT